MSHIKLIRDRKKQILCHLNKLSVSLRKWNTHTHTPLCEPHQCKRPRSWCDRCWGRWPAAAGPARTWSGATRCLRSDSASPAPTSQRPGPRRCLRSQWCARGARQLSGSPGPPGCSDRSGPAGWRRWCPPRRGSPSWRQERKNNQSVCWLWVTVKSSCSHVISRPCFCKHPHEIMEIQTQKKWHIIRQSRVKSFCQTLSLRRGEGEESLPTVRLLEKCTLGLALHCVAVEKNGTDQK